MCYKTDKHSDMAKRRIDSMQEEGVPKFIKDYYSRFKSEVSKYNYWPHLNTLLRWLYDEGIISTTIRDLNPEELNKVTSTDLINYLLALQVGAVKNYKKMEENIKEKGDETPVYLDPNRLSTLETKKNSFGAFWKYLVRLNYVSNNIVDDIPSNQFKSEASNYSVKIPTPEQLDSFIERVEAGNNNSFDCIRNAAIVQLFLGSGIRSEELMGLDIEDLHLDDTPASIDVLGKGKQEHKDNVLISSKAKHYLEEYLIARDEFMDKNGIVDEPALFLSNQKNRLSKNPITRFFNEYSDGQINPHMLRHWVGTKLYENTKDIVRVQRQLRHKNLETTAAYYVHTNKEDMASAVESLAG